MSGDTAYAAKQRLLKVFNKDTVVNILKCVEQKALIETALVDMATEANNNAEAEKAVESRKVTRTRASVQAHQDSGNALRSKSKETTVNGKRTGVGVVASVDNTSHKKTLAEKREEKRQAQERIVERKAKTEKVVVEKKQRQLVSHQVVSSIQQCELDGLIVPQWVYMNIPEHIRIDETIGSYALAYVTLRQECKRLKKNMLTLTDRDLLAMFSHYCDMHSESVQAQWFNAMSDQKKNRDFLNRLQWCIVSCLDVIDRTATQDKEKSDRAARQASLKAKREAEIAKAKALKEKEEQKIALARTKQTTKNGKAIVLQAITTKKGVTSNKKVR